MADTLTTKTVEGSSGVLITLPFHNDGSNRDYPLAKLVPTELGGLSVSSLITAGTTNATIVKTSAGQLYGLDCTNVDATIVHLKIYNKATTPDENDTPILRIPVPAGTALQRVELRWVHGIPFSAGISFRIVTGQADNNTDVVTTLEQIIQLYYK